MKNSLLVSSVILFLFAFSYAVKQGDGNVPTAPSREIGSGHALLARVDGKEITRADIDYDLHQRRAFEQHRMEVKLYREQQLLVNKRIDQLLVEKEAARRKLTPEELLDQLNAKVEEGTNAIEAKREHLVQEFVHDIAQGNPLLAAKGAPENQQGLVQGLFSPENGIGSPLAENLQTTIIEMKKEAYRRSRKKEFFDALRKGSTLEIFIERPELLKVPVSTDDDPFLGGKNAPVTIIAFADYQCPFSSKAGLTLKDLLAKRGERVKVVFRDFPLPSHRNATMAAEAAECADEQGKFWEYSELLLRRQSSLSYEHLKEYARDRGLNTALFTQCLDTGKQRSEVEKDAADAKRAGFTTTPSIVINGYYVSGVPTLAYLEEVIEAMERGQTPRVREDAGKG